MAKHILLVDDDTLLRRSLTLILQQAGYGVSAAASAEEALDTARFDPPDLILLDIGLPGMDGLNAMRSFQQAAQINHQADIPIIFLTARRRELDQVLGLELGGDDYITKPFELNVLLARIKAVLRRSERSTPAASETTLTIGDLMIDPAAHTVTMAGRVIDLSPLEFALLHALAIDAGHVVAVDNLLSRVWGAEYSGESQVVYVHIRWLREKLEIDPQHPQRIVTVRGVGYKLELQGN